MRKGYNSSVDWWALGVLIFEMIDGKCPFFSTEPEKTFEKIIAGKVKYSSRFSTDAKTLLQNLLEVV